MDWSKARQLLESRFAAPVQGRVHVYMTRYHRAHDQEGELWVTIDGAKVYGASYYQFIKRRAEFESPAPDWRPTARHMAVEQELRSQGVAAHDTLAAAAVESLNQSVEDMLRSEHPFIRALAVLDRRMGRRRLATLEFMAEHDLVKSAASLRAAWRPKDAVSVQQS